jgi:hypothetical protein
MKPLILPDEIYSPDQLSMLIMDINDYQSALRDQVARARTKSKLKTEMPEASAHLQSVLEAIGIDKITPDGLDALRKALTEILSKACVAHVTLAALPNLTIKKKVASWFRQEISPNMLLTFSVRTDIGGGAVVQAGSHVYDFSFRNLLIANKAKLAEIATRV